MLTFDIKPIKRKTNSPLANSTIIRTRREKSEPPINNLSFISEKDEEQKSPLKDTGEPKTIEKKKRSFIKRGLAIFGIIIFSIALLFGYKLYTINKNIHSGANDAPSLFSQFKRFIFLGDKQIRGDTEDRINVLLLGMGGAGHDGAYLTDTIILASIRPSDKKVALLSIPRDLAVEYPDGSFRKINALYAYGKSHQDENTSELSYIRESIEKLTAQEVHYEVLVDFEGFRKIIDELGGVNIEVEQAFTDYQYPDYNHGYQTIFFEQGWQHMDGEKALQYTRSRHGNNGEGSDFARAKRQQKIIMAVKNKSLSFGNLANPFKLADELSILGDHVKTNLELWEMKKLFEAVKDVENESIVNKVLDNRDGGLLTTTSVESGAYLLIPKKKDYSEIHELAKNIFKDETKQVQKDEASSKQEEPQENKTQTTAENEEKPEEKSELVVLNSTKINGLAGKTADDLKKKHDFKIKTIANANQDQMFEKTLIYANNNDHSAKERILEEYFSQEALHETLPDSYNNEYRLSDFVIVLGNDRQ